MAIMSSSTVFLVTLRITHPRVDVDGGKTDNISPMSYLRLITRVTCSLPHSHNHLGDTVDMGGLSQGPFLSRSLIPSPRALVSAAHGGRRTRLISLSKLVTWVL